MIYGNEGCNSTGQLSSNVVLTGIRTCHSRSIPHLIYWDEPDLGMGEEEASGTGIVLQEFLSEKPKHTQGVFITSHSRALVRELLPLAPHYIHLGIPAPEAPQSLQEWLDRPITPIHPDTLHKSAVERSRNIQSILNHTRKKGQK